MRVILIYATGYLYSSSNPMLWFHTVLALLRTILICNYLMLVVLIRVYLNASDYHLCLLC
jgi:hypothetical protein